MCHAENFNYNDQSPAVVIHRLPGVPRISDPAISPEMRAEHGNRVFDVVVNVRAEDFRPDNLNRLHERSAACDAEHEEPWFLSVERFHRSFSYLREITVLAPTDFAVAF